MYSVADTDIIWWSSHIQNTLDKNKLNKDKNILITTLFLSNLQFQTVSG